MGKGIVYHFVIPIYVAYAMDLAAVSLLVLQNKSVVMELVFLNVMMKL